MNASSRRHIRYIIPEAALLSQKIHGKGLVAFFRGQSDCRVRDLSSAGALILADRKFGIGDVVCLELTQRNGLGLRFEGKVVNCGTEPGSGKRKYGVSLTPPKRDSGEHQFLESLASSFQEAR